MLPVIGSKTQCQNIWFLRKRCRLWFQAMWMYLGSNLKLYKTESAQWNRNHYSALHWQSGVSWEKRLSFQLTEPQRNSNIVGHYTGLVFQKIFHVEVSLERSVTDPGFPWGGEQQPIIRQHFSQKLHENEINWTEWGACTRSVPLGSSLGFYNLGLELITQ